MGTYDMGHIIWIILYRLTTVVPIDRHGSIRPEFSLHLDFVADITCILIVLVRKGIQNLLRYCSTVYFLHLKQLVQEIRDQLS